MRGKRTKRKPARDRRGLNAAARAWLRRVAGDSRQVHAQFVYGAFINGAYWADAHPAALRDARKKGRRRP